ncbi:acyltransferase [Pedobacter frigoris]|uniref:acyltransferase n=1 Tax=Pedobacter frigoris TaxID=2571272 RepID=UPI00293044FC|nr:acyltransferase [Pedobacter frigoris]
MKSIYKIILNYRNKLILKRITSKFGSIGVGVKIWKDIKVSFPSKLVIGDHVYIGPNAFIQALGGVGIERGTIIGPDLRLYSANHRFKQAASIPYDEHYDKRQVMVKENVWIGGGVIIVPGVVIEEGAVVGAGSVVTKSVPKFAIVAGNPAKVIGYRDEEEYLRLKSEDMIYLKLKNSGSIRPNYL